MTRKTDPGQSRPSLQGDSGDGCALIAVRQTQGITIQHRPPTARLQAPGTSQCVDVAGHVRLIAPSRLAVEIDKGAADWPATWSARSSQGLKPHSFAAIRWKPARLSRCSRCLGGYGDVCCRCCICVAARQVKHGLGANTCFA